MTRRKLPIGIQTFRKLREDDFYYVDKYVEFTLLTGVRRSTWTRWSPRRVLRRHPV